MIFLWQKSISFKRKLNVPLIWDIGNFEVCHLKCAVSIFPYLATALSIEAILEHWSSKVLLYSLIKHQWTQHPEYQVCQSS